MLMWRLAPLLAAAAALYWLLPPRALEVGSAVSSGAVRGAIHVHTVGSDGTGTVDDVARAAAQAGLSFVIITDHGDGASLPEPPSYRYGVLCIQAVEISSDDGHVVAIGLPRAPYPLGGDARSVVEDIHRLGGWAVAAHPGSPKLELAWRDWDVPVDGIEWVNGDSEWRDESARSLIRVLLTYPFRPREALATLLDRPEPVLRRWDALTATRPVVGIAAADAHARVGLTSVGEPYDTRWSIPLPSYVAVFSVLSVVVDGVTLSKDAATDAAVVERALREGRVYSIIDGLASGGQLAFTATNGEGSASIGQTLASEGPVTLRVTTTAPPGASITLLRNGEVVRTVTATQLEEIVSAGRAAYRVEVSLPGVTGTPAIPWMVSNPIYVGGFATPTPAASTPTSSTRRFTEEQLGAARIERSPASEGATSVTRNTDAPELLFRYALGGRKSDHPYAALVLPVPVSAPLMPGDSIRFEGRSDRPMRLSVQLRSPSGGDERWRYSIFLDETARDIVVRLADMRPVSTVTLDATLTSIDSMMFVVDEENTRLGNGGRVWIKNLGVGK